MEQHNSYKKIMAHDQTWEKIELKKWMGAKWSIWNSWMQMRMRRQAEI